MVCRSHCVVAGTFVLAVVAVVGCAEQGDRLNAPPQGDSTRPSELQKNFIYMTDNAAMHDSSVADIHFEPHVAELSGIGVRRLTRTGELLSICGGVICYETSLRDEVLIEARLETLRTFLASAGFDTERITVEAGMSRSRVATADEAIEAKGSATSAETETGASLVPTSNTGS